MNKDKTQIKDLGKKMHALAIKLYPICRSITGNGARKTLKILDREIPIKVYEIPTGTPVFDWTVPQEWNIKDAFVKDSQGKKIVDFKKNNLHVASYSLPVHKKVSFEELKKHLYSLPDQSDAIPYRTLYYERDWLFCLAYRDFKKLTDQIYEVMIDSEHKDGSLTYGEFYKKGREKDEILVFTHICHPSLANDNLSGIVICVYLAKLLTSLETRYSYRFVFAPTTIGAITWLSNNQKRLTKIVSGIVVAEAGDHGHPRYKRSRQGRALIDGAMEYVLAKREGKFEISDFNPWGHDERQFCSPGINLPVGSFTRTPHEQYPEYHTSKDNLDFIRPKALEDSLRTIYEALQIIERNRVFVNTNPKGEPQLGKRGIYSAMNVVGEERKLLQKAMLWVLNFSDRENSLLAIAKRSGIDFEVIDEAARILEKAKLLKEIKNE